MGRAAGRTGDRVNERRGALSAKTRAFTIQLAAGGAVHCRVQNECRSRRAYPGSGRGVTSRTALRRALLAAATRRRCETTRGAGRAARNRQALGEPGTVGAGPEGRIVGTDRPYPGPAAGCDAYGVCRVFAYLGEPVLLDGPLFGAENSLVTQSVGARLMSLLNIGGFGLTAWDALSPEPGNRTCVERRGFRCSIATSRRWPRRCGPRRRSRTCEA